MGFMGRYIRVTYGKPPAKKPYSCKTAFFKNMAFKDSKDLDQREQVKMFFCDCGQINGISLLKTVGSGFIDFETEQGVENAVAKSGQLNIKVGYGPPALSKNEAFVL